MIECGLRVVRGPDWKWKDQDGGEGHVGTVVDVGKVGSNSSPEKTVVVHWDSGTRTNYRVGYQTSFDLRIFDNATLGVRHRKTKCNECPSESIEGMRFKCSKCYNYNLCIECYMTDKHELNHSFIRYLDENSNGLHLPKRIEHTLKIVSRGIFPGAKVVRGIDWDWGEQDGHNEGIVLDIRGWEDESARSVANVKWSHDATNVYRLGHKAKIDLAYVKGFEASGISYYPEHLPNLGQSYQDLSPINQRFKIGDRVKVDLDVDVLKVMQEGHGGWNPRMQEFIGVAGLVHRITDKGDIRVQYQGIPNRWTFHPDALTLIPIQKFKVGDTVRIIDEIKIVRNLQKGHGEWTDQMEKALSKQGTIIKIYPDGDLRVNVDSQSWTFNPASVSLSKNEQLLNSFTEKLTLIDNKKMDIYDAISKGNLRLTQDIVNKDLSILFTKDKKRNLLHLAVQTEFIDIVEFLIKKGSNLHAIDKEGNTPLHLATLADRIEICKHLLTVGADIHSLNKFSCTPLHIAVKKNSIELVKLFLSFNANVNAKDESGETPLHDSLIKDFNEIANLLFNSPTVNVTLPSNKNFNALHLSALKGNKRAVEIIIGRCPQIIDLQKDDGFTALHLAALNDHLSIVVTLVDSNADIERLNRRKQTALMLACSQGHIKVAKYLVEKGADLDKSDERNETCLHMALNSQAKDKMKSLENNFTDNHLKAELNLSSYVGPDELLLACFLIKSGALIYAESTPGKTPIKNLTIDQQKLLISYAKMCIICEENIADVKFEPCNHRISCRHCCKKMKRCLECKEKIISKVFPDKTILQVVKDTDDIDLSNHLALKRSISYEKTMYSSDDDESNMDITVLKKRVRNLEDTITCNICMARIKNVAFMCGHQACSQCSAPLKLCHICRKQITKRINTFN